MYSVGGKRPFEGSVEMGAPEPKRAALNENREVFSFCNWGETVIPIDVMTRIVSFLSVPEIFQFPALAKGAGFFTEVRFKEIKQRNRMDFSLPGNEKESYPERASYLSVSVLMKYLNRREALIQIPFIPHTTPQIKALYQEFQGIMRHLPCSLGRFMWKDLTSMGHLQSQDKKLFLGESSSQASGNANLASPAGRELLQGLPHLTTSCDLMWKGNLQQAFLSQGEALVHLNNAIHSGATITPWFAMKMLSPFLSCYPILKYCENLAIVSASHKDYRGLELFLTKNMMDAAGAYQSGLHYPPILGALALRKMNGPNNPQDVELSFEAAIEGYGDPSSIPAKVWIYAGGNKYILSKYREAEAYLERVLEQEYSLSDLDRFYLRYYLTMAQTELKKWNEAEKSSTKLFIASSISALTLAPHTYASIALIKTMLHKREEGNYYLDKALSHPNQPDASTWGKAAIIKVLDKRWEEAERFAQNYMNCVNSPSSDMLARMALIKFRLKNLLEAKAYIDKALTAFQANALQVPPKIEEFAKEVNAQYSLLNISNRKSS